MVVFFQFGRWNFKLCKKMISTKPLEGKGYKKSFLDLNFILSFELLALNRNKKGIRYAGDFFVDLHL